MWGEAVVRLEVGEQLDEDGLGVLHHGTLAQQPVLVRRLRERLDEAPQVLSRLADLLPRVRSLMQPNVVRLLDIRLEETPRTLVYEQPKGRSLRAVLKERRRLTVNQAISIAKGLAAALQEARGAGWVHGDLRTRNVFVDGAGNVQLLGFGLAEAICAASGYQGLGMSFGHPLYLAPEAVSIEAPTPETDVYALGILMQRMVLGAHPYTSKDLREVLRCHQTESLPTEHKGVSIPPKLAAVLAAMTAKDPNDRPMLGPALFEELHHVDAFEGSLCEEDAPLIPIPPTPERDEDETPEPDEDPSGAGAVMPSGSSSGSSSMLETISTALKASASGRRAAAPPSAALPTTPLPLAARGVNAKQLVVSLFGLLAIAGGMAFVATLEPSGADPDAAAVKRPPPSRAPTPPSSVVAKERTREAEALAALDTIGGALDVAVGSDLDRARGLFNQLPKHVASDEGKKRVEALRAKVTAAGEQALLKEMRAIQRHLEAGDVWRGGAAWRRVQVAYQRRPRLLQKPEVSEVVARIQRWERARGWEVARLRTGKPLDVQVVQGQLTSRLKGWLDGGRIYYGGGVQLRYHHPAQLLADLSAPGEAKRHRDTLALAGRKLPAVCIQPGDYTLDLPLLRPLDVTIELVLKTKPTDARFEVYCGRVGSSWGLAPIAGARGKPTASLSSLPLNRRMLLQLRFDDRNARTLTLNTCLKTAAGVIGKSTQATVQRPDARGKLTLRVRGGAVWITQLELRGSLDPAGLR